MHPTMSLTQHSGIVTDLTSIRSNMRIHHLAEEHRRHYRAALWLNGLLHGRIIHKVLGANMRVPTHLWIRRLSRHLETIMLRYYALSS